MNQDERNTIELIKARIKPTQNYQILEEVTRKLQQGAKEYGPLDLETAKYDFKQEALEEYYDAINYLAFRLLQNPGPKEKRALEYCLDLTIGLCSLLSLPQPANDNTCLYCKDANGHLDEEETFHCYVCNSITYRKGAQ